MLKTRLEATIPASYGRLADFVRDARAKREREQSPTRQRVAAFWERTLEGRNRRDGAGGRRSARRAGARRRDRSKRRQAKAPIRRARSISSARGRAIPDLLTFRALRADAKAEVVLYDRLVDPSHCCARARREDRAHL